MMDPQFSFWQLSIIILHCVVFPTAINAESVFVRPNTSVTCVSSQQPCLTFNEYAQQPGQYFVDNTTFLFLPGTHELDVQLDLEGLSNILFAPLDEVNNPTDTVQILLRSLINITFTNCENIEISGLVYILSGKRVNVISRKLFEYFPLLAFQNTTGQLTMLTLIGDGIGVFIACFSSHVEISNMMAINTKAQTLDAYNSTIDFYGQNTFHSNNVDINILAEAGYILAFENCYCNFSGNTSFVYSTRAIIRALGDNHVTIISGNLSVVNTTMHTLQNTISFFGGISIFSGILSFVNNIIISTYPIMQSAISFMDSMSVISGNLSFVNNSFNAMKFRRSTTNISGSILFISNTAHDYKDSSQIYLLDRATCYISGNISFLQNDAYTGGFEDIEGGGAIFIAWSALSISGVAAFVRNRALARYIETGSYGGAILSQYSTMTFEESSDISFFENFATSYGGAIYMELSNLTMYGRVLFEKNFAGVGGGAIASELYTSTMIKCNGSRIIFRNNTSHERGGAIYAFSYIFSPTEYTSVALGDVMFERNTATLDGGAVYALDSFINMTGTLQFIENSAQQGGAIAFITSGTSSKLLLTEPLTANFTDNSATNSGGAIFFDGFIPVRQICKQYTRIEFPPICFIELSSEVHIKLNFDSNNADNAGRLIFGGNLDNCEVFVGGELQNPWNTIASISNMNVNISNHNMDNTTSNISSDALQVCICKNYGLECNYTEMETVRGRKFTLQAVIVGQGLGAIPSAVRISLDNGFQISATQHIQPTGKVCTNLSYRLFGESNTTEVTLFPDNGPCRDLGIGRTRINITFSPCPSGLIQNGSECVCEERLQHFNPICDVDTNSIEQTSRVFWMGAVYENDSNESAYQGLILHAGCPFDYCVNTPVPITLDNLDIQCNYNHSGTLCGSCREGYSIALGTLHCLPCSNDYLTLILPFALAGIALVAVLLLLRLTVTAGTINGLIFYANVVQMNHSFFFPAGVANILTVFIAWLNLDLGIETCFYDGMTTYAYTWLQFVFPFYVWFLVGLIIVVTHYSTKLTKVFGHNPVATLATLFLLSYSKLLRTIIATLSITELEFPHNKSRMVWLYDGNVAYAGSGEDNHLILVIFAILILVFLFIPYTLLLFFAHWLQALSHWRILSWLNKIKPFMDTYHAPYKKQTRYWTGLFLFVRLILFIFTAIRSDLIPIAITSIMVVLLALAWTNVHGIYENHRNNILEAFFVANLCMFAAITYYKQTNELIHVETANFFVGFAFTAFICIVLFHIYMVLYETAAWKKIPRPNIRKYFIRKRKDNKNLPPRSHQQNIILQVPTEITIDLSMCEPLLEQ